MKITKRMGWILAGSALLALEAGAQSSGSQAKLGSPSFGLTPGGKGLPGSLEDDVHHSGSMVKFFVPLGKPSQSTSPGGSASLRVAAIDIRKLRHAATGVRIDLAALSAASARLAERALQDVGDRISLRIAAPGYGLIDVDVRKRVHVFEVTLTPASELGKPAGGLTPGGKSTSQFLLIDDDVRTRAHDFEVALSPASGLGNPAGGLTPGGKSTSQFLRVARPVSDRR